MKKNSLFTFLLVCFVSLHIYAVQEHLSTHYIRTHLSGFRNYLEDYAKKMKMPWWMIRSSMQLLGYTKEEINAVPIAYPLLYEEKYIPLFDFCSTQKFQEEVNALLETIIDKQILWNDKKRKRIEIHHIIHEWNCKKLQLPCATSTKELAERVQKKSMDMDEFCKLQLVQFFVQYHLGI